MHRSYDLGRMALGIGGSVLFCLALPSAWAGEANPQEGIAGSIVRRQQEGDEPKGAAGQSERKKGFALAHNYRLWLGGQYRVLGDGSNFGFHDSQIAEDQQSFSSVNQRLRTWLNLGQRDSHGVYIQLEIGHTKWGDDREFPKTHSANGDEVGVELRRGYLWWRPSERSLVRVGVQDWHDRFTEKPTFEDPLWAVDAYDSFRAVLANSIWDFNVGGVSVEGRGGEAWHYRFGAFWLGEGNETLTGDGSAILAVADADVEAGSALWGGSAYYVRDRGDYSYGTFGGPKAVYDSSWDLWAGIRGHFSAGAWTPSFFVIYNTGETEDPGWEHTGWAARLATGIDTSLGKFELQGLYSTGDGGSSATRSDEFRTIAQSERDNLGSQGYWSLLGLTSPRGSSDTADLGVGLQNQGLGLLSVQASLEHQFHERVGATFAAGWLQAAEEHPTSGEKDMGIEVLAEIGWTLSGLLRLDAGGAYLFTGDFFRAAAGGDPEDLYEIYARLQLEI